MDESKQLRKKVIQMSFDAHACHLGSALSCCEIVLALDKMKGSLVFSKASGAATVYALTGKDSQYLKENPFIYPGGSLGHGLPIATGMALGNRSKKVYVLMSDAELNEGTTWESLLFASHHNLNNLIIVIDYNKLQACGSTTDICDLEPLTDKFKAFGCEVRTVKDGHNQQIIETALTYPPLYRNKPIVIIAHTTKGKGVDFCENNYEWHYKNLSKSQLENALSQLI